MKYFNITVAIMSLVLWGIFLFDNSTIIKIPLGFCIGWTAGMTIGLNIRAY